MTYFLIYLRGLAMGAADIVPGVSGGTIAFITGIYDRLLFALSSLTRDGLKVLFKEGVIVFWVRQDMTFLTVLLAGILTSIGLFAHVIKFFLDHHAEALWSFFFGLILSASWLVARNIEQWHWTLAIWFLLGLIGSTWLSLLAPVQIEPSLWQIFLIGAVAICAMVLPGISGSFVLVLLGLYETIITAIQTLNWAVLMSFVAGCLSGLLAFVHIVSYFLRRHRAPTLVLLLGLMLGALVKIWPWKTTLSVRINSEGQTVPVHQQNIWPMEYIEAMPNSASLLTCVLLMLLGGALLVGIERWAGNNGGKR